jgi:hypothetical protein
MSREQPMSEVEMLVRQLIEALHIEVDERDLKISLRYAIQHVKHEKDGWPSDELAQQLLSLLRQRRTRVEELIAAADAVCAKFEELRTVLSESVAAAEIKRLRDAADDLRKLHFDRVGRIEDEAS